MPEGTYALSGPGVTAEAGHLPVRGDLAHIKLAGRYFVPHYAVPLPHAIAAAGAILRKTGIGRIRRTVRSSWRQQFRRARYCRELGMGPGHRRQLWGGRPVGYVALAQLAKPGA